MTFRIRQLEEHDLHAMAALHFYMWHDFYGSFMPQTFVNEYFALKKCEDKQFRLLKNCQEHPDKYKALVAVNEKNELLGTCYIAKSGGKPRVNNLSDLPNFDTELHRLYTWPAARGKGLGTEFLRRFVPWFQQNDYKSCFAWSFDENPYNVFYNKRGAEPYKTVQADYAGKKLSVTAFAWHDFVDTFKR